MSHPQPGSSRIHMPTVGEQTSVILRRVYAHHFAEVRRLEARRLAAARRRRGA